MRSSLVALALALASVAAIWLASCGEGNGGAADQRAFIEDTERPPDGALGAVATVQVAFEPGAEPISVIVDVIDGLALFEGDIVLGRVEELHTAGLVHSARHRVWPEGVVPYVISEALNATMRQRIEDAIEHWEDRTPVRFVRRTDQADYVTFIHDDTLCASRVGRQGGEQFVRLAPGCQRGTVIHEIGHVVGLWHEQSRHDRDSYVQILEDNVIDGKLHNFEQKGTWGIDVRRFDGDYDFDSIMHYGPRAFGRPDEQGGRLQTIVTRPPGIPIGQRDGLSDGDVFAVEQLYVPPRLVSFTATPGQVATGEAVVLEWLVDEPDAHELQCLLDVLGNGQPDYVRTGSACDGRQTLQHAFTAAGTYTVTMTLDDGIGVKAQASVTIVVEGSAGDSEWVMDLRVGALHGYHHFEPGLNRQPPPWESNSVAPGVTPSLTIDFFSPFAYVYVALERNGMPPTRDVDVWVELEGEAIVDGVYPAGAYWEVFVARRSTLMADPGRDHAEGHYRATAIVDGEPVVAIADYAAQALPAPEPIVLSTGSRTLVPPATIGVQWRSPAENRRTAVAVHDDTRRWLDLRYLDPLMPVALPGPGVDQTNVAGRGYGAHRVVVTAHEWDPTLPRSAAYPHPVPATFRSTSASIRLDVGRQLELALVVFDPDDPRRTGDDGLVWMHAPPAPPQACTFSGSFFFFDCVWFLRDGALVTLTAEDGAGYDDTPTVFVGWGGDCADAGNERTCSVVLDADRSVTVRFVTDD